MSRRPARFTETDLKRAAKVAKALGVAIDIMPDGTIRVAPAPETASTPQTPPKRVSVL